MKSIGRVPRSMKHGVYLFLMILSCTAGAWKRRRPSLPLAAKVELGRSRYPQPSLGECWILTAAGSGAITSCISDRVRNRQGKAEGAETACDQ